MFLLKFMIYYWFGFGSKNYWFGFGSKICWFEFWSIFRCHCWRLFRSSLESLGILYSFHPFILFSKVKIADIILNFSFCISIILDYFSWKWMISIFLFLGNHVFRIFFTSIIAKQVVLTVTNYLFSLKSRYITKYWWTIVFGSLFFDRILPSGMAILMPPT